MLEYVKPQMLGLGKAQTFSFNLGIWLSFLLLSQQITTTFVA